jgi:5-methylcytosine-specific restriction endonuclease McrA
MAKFDPITRHPIAGLPYEKVAFVRMTPRRDPLYRVEGHDASPTDPFDALGTAFAIYGGCCFYCGKKFKPQPLSGGKAHRDHVVPDSKGGSDRLHNLLIACHRCGTSKASKEIHRFNRRAADKYLAAIERHIARCLGAAEP